MDVDFAVLVTDWKTFNQLADDLSTREGYNQHPRMTHRFYGKGDSIFDIIREN